MTAKLMPKKPTEEMIAAMYDIHPCGPTDKLTRAYKAAYAAAPEQPDYSDLICQHQNCGACISGAIAREFEEKE